MNNYSDFYCLMSNTEKTCKNDSKMTQNSHFLTLFDFFEHLKSYFILYQPDLVPEYQNESLIIQNTFFN